MVNDTVGDYTSLHQIDAGSHAGRFAPLAIVGTSASDDHAIEGGLYGQWFGSNRFVLCGTLIKALRSKPHYMVGVAAVVLFPTLAIGIPPPSLLSLVVAIDIATEDGAVDKCPVGIGMIGVARTGRAVVDSLVARLPSETTIDRDTASHHKRAMALGISFCSGFIGKGRSRIVGTPGNPYLTYYLAGIELVDSHLHILQGQTPRTAVAHLAGSKLWLIGRKLSHIQNITAGYRLILIGSYIERLAHHPGFTGDIV